MDEQTQASFDTVMAFMGAMGSGDMEAMGALMADDMVWHNEGDESLPWIGETRGKENIFTFLGVFSENLQTTKWENTDAFASGDTVAVFGVMNAITTHSGKETGDFTFQPPSPSIYGHLTWHPKATPAPKSHSTGWSRFSLSRSSFFTTRLLLHPMPSRTPRSL